MTVKFTDNSQQALNRLQHGIQSALSKIGAAAVGHIRDNMDAYPIYDTGDLRRSYDFEADPEGKKVTIGSKGINYAVFNELGTAKMPARPHLAPALKDNIDEYQSIVTNEIKSNLS